MYPTPFAAPGHPDLAPAIPAINATVVERDIYKISVEISSARPHQL